VVVATITGLVSASSGADFLASSSPEQAAIADKSKTMADLKFNIEKLPVRERVSISYDGVIITSPIS
jgi:hypothetical protein